MFCDEHSSRRGERYLRINRWCALPSHPCVGLTTTIKEMSSGHSSRENMPEDRSAAMTGRGMDPDFDETPLRNGESVSPLDTSSPPGTRGIWRLTLSELCELIVEDRSLRRAVIISTETCIRYGVFRDHRFLVLELRDGAKTRYLRLDGSLWASGGAATIAIHEVVFRR